MMPVEKMSSTVSEKNSRSKSSSRMTPSSGNLPAHLQLLKADHADGEQQPPDEQAAEEDRQRAQQRAAQHQRDGIPQQVPAQSAEHTNVHGLALSLALVVAGFSLRSRTLKGTATVWRQAASGVYHTRIWRRAGGAVLWLYWFPARIPLGTS